MESLKRSWTFFITIFLYTETSPEMTSFSKSFRICSSYRVKFAMRASGEGTNVASSKCRGSLGDVVAFLFLSQTVGTTRMGHDLRPSTIFIPPRGRGKGRCSSAPPQDFKARRRSSRDVMLVARGASWVASLRRGIKDLTPVWYDL